MSGTIISSALKYASSSDEVVHEIRTYRNNMAITIRAGLLGFQYNVYFARAWPPDVAFLLRHDYYSWRLLEKKLVVRAEVLLMKVRKRRCDANSDENGLTESRTNLLLLAETDRAVLDTAPDPLLKYFVARIGWYFQREEARGCLD